MPPGRGSVAGRNFLASPYYSQRAVFASPLSAFFIFTYFITAKCFQNKVVIYKLQ